MIEFALSRHLDQLRHETSIDVCAFIPPFNHDFSDRNFSSRHSLVNNDNRNKKTFKDILFSLPAERNRGRRHNLREGNVEEQKDTFDCRSKEETLQETLQETHTHPSTFFKRVKRDWSGKERLVRESV